VSATTNTSPAPASDSDDESPLPAPAPALNEQAREESALVLRVQQGDIDAFDVLVRRYMEGAYRVAYRVLQHRQDAEDLVQDSFLRALERIDQCAPGRPFGPWFFRIVMTQGLNARRQRKRRETAALPEDIHAAGLTPDAEVERAGEQARLRAAIARLPKQQQLIVQLSELEGFTSQEIAGMLDVAPGTVRWHLHEARAALRAALRLPPGEAR
jgi:RNA polymerase sigma-70 factor (ECF subfamily)